MRSAAGYSQRDLAAEVGISQRMVAYYEKQTAHPPTTLLPAIARALKVSSDELLGLKRAPKEGKPGDGRLWRRFKQMENLSPSVRRQVVQVIDAFLEREKLRKHSPDRAGARASRTDR